LIVNDELACSADIMGYGIAEDEKPRFVVRLV
jgi:hypothetical protein